MHETFCGIILKASKVVVKSFWGTMFLAHSVYIIIKTKRSYYMLQLLTFRIYVDDDSMILRLMRPISYKVFITLLFSYS